MEHKSDLEKVDRFSRVVGLFGALYRSSVLSLPALDFYGPDIPKDLFGNSNNHDLIKPLPQTLRHHTIFSEFQPYLQIDHGCVPFPAIDTEGVIGEGLAPEGSVDGDCQKSIGQTYTRIGSHGDMIAVMYAWYFPKEQVSQYSIVGAHRHSWHNVILWFKDIYDTEPTIISTEKDGKYTANMLWDQKGTHPLISKYFEGTSVISGRRILRPFPQLQPLVEWEQMSSKLRDRLDLYVYNQGLFTIPWSTNCPFNRLHFTENLAAAYNFK